MFVRLSVDDRSNLVEGVDIEDPINTSAKYVVRVDTGDDEIMVSDSTDLTTPDAIVLANDYVIYDEDYEIISLRDLDKGDEIAYYEEKAGINTFAKYVRIVTPAADVDEDPVVDEAITLSGDVLTVKGLDATADYTLVNTTSGSGLKYNTISKMATTTYSAIALTGGEGVHEFNLYKGTAATPIVTEEFFVRPQN